MEMMKICTVDERPSNPRKIHRSTATVDQDTEHVLETDLLLSEMEAGKQSPGSRTPSERKSPVCVSIVSDGGLSNGSAVTPIPPKSDDEDHQRKEKLRAWKNIIILDIAIMLYHSPMMTYTNLMSSLNSNEGMGLASESINAGILLCGSLFLCTYATKRWTARRIILAACILTIPYLLINFHVVWATIIPGSMMAGIGDCLITQAIGVYYSDIATYYSKMFGNNRESFLLRLFGLGSVLTQGSFILGNLLVWRILDTDHLWNRENCNNSTIVPTCGAKFCNEELVGSTSLQRPEQWRIYILCGIFTAMGLLAALSLLLVDDYSQSSKETCPTFLTIGKEMVALFHQPKQLMLVLVTTLTGLYEGFFFGDFTQAYVSCSIGISQVGLVMICYGVANGLFAMCQETLSNWFGRIPMMTFGGILLSSLVAVLLHWDPQKDQFLLYYIAATVWGLADAVLATHISTLFGTLYQHQSQAAYSCQTFWYGVGLCISFGYSYYLCVSTKLYILAALVTASMLSYYGLEVYLSRTKSEIPVNSPRTAEVTATDIKGGRRDMSVSQAVLLAEAL